MEQVDLFRKGATMFSKATPDDIKDYLKSKGMVAVYRTDVEHVATCYNKLTQVPRYKRIVESLLKTIKE